MPLSDLDPNANGVIRADSRDSEKFNVLQGIPTSEYLYTNTLADNYLFKQNWAQQSGKTTYSCSVTVTYVRKWTVPGPPICAPPPGGCSPGPELPAGDTQTKTYSFQIYRDYGYWQINNLEVYQINNTIMNNYALPGGSVTMYPNGYTPPTLSQVHSTVVGDHVHPVDTPTINYTPPILTGGLSAPPTIPDDTSLLKGMAESSTPESKVNNDTVKFNNATTMDGAQYTKTGPTPSNIPMPVTIGRDVLYKNQNLVSNALANKPNTSSSGTIYYDLLPENVNGGASTSYPING
ncbi:DUF5704 domain-containing protein, partial [Paenibacillus marchantiophytorum]|uniref:DUF5704 domain-containing protein n=1 Tax=Paenibacillus marchantiophytorum TaxID=1619310 RepID=UPI001E2B4FE7